MNLELQALAARIGITEYPAELEPVFEAICQEGTTVDIVKTIEQLHLEFEPFGAYYDFLLRGAKAIQQDEALLAWITLGILYCMDASEQEAAAFPLPPCDESLERDAFPALLLALEFPETVKRYRAHGFDDAQIKKCLGNLAESLRVHEITQGRVTISKGLYIWMTHYTKARIFDLMGFNFQIKNWHDETILLKHRTRNEYAFLLLKGSFTADGAVAGIRGAEEIPPLFEATVEETEDAFLGYRANGQRANTVRERFDKREWEAVLRPGDNVIGFHIPRGADFTPSHVENAIAEATGLIARYYPESPCTYTVCTSWMLDPKLLDVLPEQSKIAQFIRHFLLHPSGDTAGDGCMSYVWPGENGSIETLSENTSLQRGIKSMMLRGKFIFWTTGVWL